MARRIWAGLVWLGTFIVQSALANLIVASLVLRPRAPVKSTMVRLPLDVRRAAAITWLGHSITLIPGTMTVDVAPDRSHLLVHVLNVDDPQATIDEIKRTLEAPIRSMLE
jgi:multisubunit Na+/H+ antiporter MnhE subunit